MKAFSKSLPALTGQAGLILLFDGEVGPAKRDHDEHSQTGILTSGLNLTPAFPACFRKPVAVGVCSPLQWRNRPRFSRGSLRLAVAAMDKPSIFIKEQFLLTEFLNSCQEKI